MDKYITAVVASDEFGISKYRLNKLEKDGKLDSEKKGREKFYFVEDILKYLKEDKISKEKVSTEQQKSVEDEENEEKGIYDPRNKLNDLTGKEWLPETKSFFYQKGLGSKHPHAQIERQHPHHSHIKT